MAGRDGRAPAAPSATLLIGAEGDLRAELLTETFEFSDDDDAQAAGTRGKHPTPRPSCDSYHHTGKDNE